MYKIYKKKAYRNNFFGTCTDVGSRILKLWKKLEFHSNLHIKLPKLNSKKYLINFQVLKKSYIIFGKIECFDNF